MARTKRRKSPKTEDGKQISTQYRGPIVEVEKPIDEYVVDDILHPNMRAFLNAIVYTGGNIQRAAEACQIAHQQHYRWLDKPIYAELYKKQRLKSIATLEAEAIRRAVEGVSEPVYQGGALVGHKQKYSDNLLMFLMKQRDPSYKDSVTTNVGIWGGEGKVNVIFNIPEPKDPELPEEIIDVPLAEIEAANSMSKEEDD